MAAAAAWQRVAAAAAEKAHSSCKPCAASCASVSIPGHPQGFGFADRRAIPEVHWQGGAPHLLHPSGLLDLADQCQQVASQHGGPHLIAQCPPGLEGDR